MTTLFKSTLIITAIFIFSACATSSASYNPKLDSNQSGIIGLFKVLQGGKNITDLCSIELTNNSGVRKAYIRLDQSGWLFAKVPSGDTKINMIMCRVGEIIKNNIFNLPQNLNFSATPGEQVYIGDFSIEMEKNPNAGSFGGAAAGMGNEVNARIEITDNFEKSQAEIKNRFPTHLNLHLKNQKILSP